MIEVFVESIRVNMTNYRRVVMLKEKTSPRYLPIWIGHFEADAIAIPMQNVPVQRPLTHDLLKGVIEQLGGKLTQVVINELAERPCNHGNSPEPLDLIPEFAGIQPVRRQHRSHQESLRSSVRRQRLHAS